MQNDYNNNEIEDLDDDFEIIRPRKLNKKKVFGAISILVIIILIVSCFVVIKISNNNHSKELAMQEQIVIKDNTDTIKEEETSEEDTNEEEDTASDEEIIEEDETLYRDGVGSDATPFVDNNQNDDKSQTEVTSETVAKSGVYDGMHLQLPEHNVESIKTNFLPKKNDNAKEEIRNIYFTDEKVVYITFDDGPSSNITPQILDILKQYDVKATFFTVGKNIERYPDILKREYSEGHYIANHGYSHSYSTIYQSKDTCYQEYVDTENCIKKALGNENYNSYLFRFPGGSSGGKYGRIKNDAKDLFDTYGVPYTNWNCLSGDAEGKTTAEECINEVKRTKGNQGGIILLMHDASDKSQTVEALPSIIEYFKDEGYSFKNFYEIFK